MIIYKTTNQINGKFYVGKDSKNNPDYYGSGNLIIKAIKKYGKENFIKEILEECSSSDELANRERYWITELDARNKNIAYNIAEGGDGGDNFSGHPDLDNIKKKISESSKGRTPWNMGKTGIYSDESIKKMSKTRSKLTGDTSSRYIHIEKNELGKQLESNTIKDTAKYYNVSISCIRRKIKDYNLEIKKKSGNFEKPLPKEIIDKIIKLRESGKTIIEIADIVCVGRNKTKKVLIENGISTKRIK